MLKQLGLYNTCSSEGFEFRRLGIFKCLYSEQGKIINVSTEFLHFEDGTGGVIFYINNLRWGSGENSVPVEGTELSRIQQNIKEVVESWNVVNATFDTDE